ncbi:MAG: response regulator [Acidobacteria bacterium]|nr:response regulator [Acidobacteriota bacterium]
MTKQRISVLVVDDEAPARANVVSLLEGDSEFVVVGEARDGKEAIDMVHALRPDIMVLDVQMPECDGFDVIEALPANESPAVIFVTAFDDFAVRAFETNAVDYLVKPFSEARLRAALERARERLGQDAKASFDALVHQVRSGATDYLLRLAVPDGEATRLLDVDQVDWIEAVDYYARIHSADATHLLKSSLTRLESQLDPSRFVRIHRSTIVNLDRIDRLAPWRGGSYAVLLQDGTRLTLSRRRRSALEAALGQAI